jgi:hypothetical protein
MLSRNLKSIQHKTIALAVCLVTWSGEQQTHVGQGVGSIFLGIIKPALRAIIGFPNNQLYLPVFAYVGYGIIYYI